jgi:hypothetical protein
MMLIILTETKNECARYDTLENNCDYMKFIQKLFVFYLKNLYIWCIEKEGKIHTRKGGYG